MNFASVVVPCLVLLAVVLVVVLCIRRMRMLRNEGQGRWRRTVERVVLYGIVIVAIAVGASTAFNASASHHYWAMHPVPGRIYTVNGYKMHMNCTGTGSPTIILDAGLGNDWTIWGKVQPVLSKTTRVCSYDRAGFGWSQAQPGPRDADHIADELHGLLNQAGITGPIVLMGHSISGIYIRAYATRYPKNVAGLIFVDGSTPLQQDHGPADLRAFESKGLTLQILLGKTLVPLGVLRDMGQCSQIQLGFEAAAGKMLAEDTCQPRLTATEDEWNNFRQSGNETIHTGPYGDLPVLIFSQDPNHPMPPQIPAKLGKELATVWNQMQDDLKNLSTRSRRIIAKGSGHYVQTERSDLVDREVPIFIQQIRGTAPQPTDYGTTKTE